MSRKLPQSSFNYAGLIILFIGIIIGLWISWTYGAFAYDKGYQQAQKEILDKNIETVSLNGVNVNVIIDTNLSDCINVTFNNKIIREVCP